MNNLILTSNGFIDGTQNNENTVNFFTKIAQGKKVMILANATLGGANFSQREPVKRNFESIGAKQVDIVDITKENENNILEYEVLYVMGGDSRFVLNMLYETNAREIIIEFLKNGGIYIGESVGSMVAGKKLKWVYDVKKGTKPKYDVEPKCYDGLGITEYNIFPHWSKYSEDVRNKAIEHEIEITPLEDGEIIEDKFSCNQ